MKTKRSEMSDLADVVVHDLKNPLAIILTSAEILSSGALDSDTVKRKSFLDRVYESAKILSSRATNIVDIERIESGTLSLRPEAMTVGRLLSSLEWIKASAERQGKTMTLEGDANAEFTLDPNLTLRLCENLLLNAIKNTSSGGKVSMVVRKDGGHISFVVNDNGFLIPKEDIKKIFDKYYKTQKDVGNSSENTGLALTFCKLVVGAMKGKISVESSQEKGTTFTVNF